jgi:hypothetical protein
MFVKTGFSFEEVQNLSLSQIKALSPAIGRSTAQDTVNTMGATRMAMHADAKDYAKTLKDLQRK